MLKDYDENQQDTVKRACARCHAVWYMKRHDLLCRDCAGWPHQGIVQAITVPVIERGVIQAGGQWTPAYD